MNYGTIETPYYLIDSSSTESLVNDMIESLRLRWKEGIIGYSFKTNNLPWIINFMKNKGLWAEVVSSDEYHLAKILGYDASNIIFNGPVKGKNEFIEAVQNGAIVNIDSKRELNWLNECDKALLSNAHIGLRVNFCIEEYCPGESQCGKEDGRFGFSYESGELHKAIEYLKDIGVRLSGLHLHCSSKTRSLNIYSAIARMAQTIVNEHNLSLQYIDIGGGFFGGMPGKPAFNEYFNVIYDVFSNDSLLKNVNLIVEPGMSLIGSSVKYVTKVIDIKKTKNNLFVLLDGSRIHIDPLMKKNGYTYHIERKNIGIDNDENCEQILCGFTCMENDRFFKLIGPMLHIEDRVVFEKVGAYTMGLSPQFISFYPTVAVENDGTAKVVRQKNKAEMFVKSNI